MFEVGQSCLWPESDLNGEGLFRLEDDVCLFIWRDSESRLAELALVGGFNSELDCLCTAIDDWHSS